MLVTTLSGCTNGRRLARPDVTQSLTLTTGVINLLFRFLRRRCVSATVFVWTVFPSVALIIVNTMYLGSWPNLVIVPNTSCDQNRQVLVN